MSSNYVIFVKNDSATQQNFFLFQKPSAFSNQNPVSVISLDTENLATYQTYGTQLKFMVDEQVYAGAATVISTTYAYNLLSQSLAEGHQQTAVQPITTANNSTTLSVSPFGLTIPVPADPPISSGSFLIKTPIYDASSNTYYLGNAVETTGGGTVLSSFVIANPNQSLTVTPQPIFGIGIGSHPSGTVLIDNQIKNTAMCDFTNSGQPYTVTYTRTGTWDITRAAA